MNSKRFEDMRERIEKINIFFDALGLVAFSVPEVDIASSAGFADNAVFLVVLGVFIVVGGGDLRNILVNEKPYILTKHIYTIASIVGSGIFYLISIYFGHKVVSTFVSVAFTILIRLLAAKHRLKLSQIKFEQKIICRIFLISYFSVRVFKEDSNMEFMLKIIVRSVLAVIIGIVIGSERARHGRAAGMRTHILVSLGAALTAMISIYANEILGYEGDIFRLSAQVISGVGFLGAGMIILKNNNVITGLTTAAGVWTTGVIGIAVGSGFYLGAAVATALYIITVIPLRKLERHKRQSEVIYIEIDDMYKANELISRIKEENNINFIYHFLSPKSGCDGNLGISIFIENRKYFNMYDLKKYESVVFFEEE